MYILTQTSATSLLWSQTHETGEAVSQTTLPDLSACPTITPHENLAVLYPGEKITLMAVKLPKMRTSEQAQAVPFALEEQLACDPEHIFFAMGDVRADGMTMVAVTDKVALDEYLKALHAAHLYPRALLPDFLSLTLSENTWTLLLRDKMAWVRTGEQTGFSVDVDNLLLLLQKTLEKEKKPESLIVFKDSTAFDHTCLNELSVPIVIRDAATHAYFDTTALSKKPAINFLQGKYRPKTQSSSLKTHWMICGAVFATLVFFLFLSQAVQWIYFSHQSAILEKQVLATYQTLFPGAKEVLEPRFRTAGLLKKFNSASKNSVFLQLLDTVGVAMLQLPSIQLQSLQFEKEQLTLSVSANNLALLNQLSQALRSAGLSVQQKVLTTQKGAVNAAITVFETAH